MRIALVSTPFVALPPPGYGGTELVVSALAAALERAGHEVAVFATGDSTLPNVRALFEHAVWPPNAYIELAHCRFAVREIAGGRFDVVHAHAPAMVAFADELDAPMVYTIHHAADPALARFYASSPPVHRVAISERQASLLAEPVEDVVHHGLEIDAYPSCGPGGDAAFFLGRLAWCKAPDLAIEAAGRAGLRIVVAGKAHALDGGPPHWEDEVLAPALRAPHVDWVHEADLAAKRRLFASSRALLVPVRWEEPFGLVLIEALLAGCPVIAFPLGAVPEIVDDGENGFLVRDVGGMAEALHRAKDLDRGRIQARARQRFSSDRMAAEYVQTYLAAISGRPRARSHAQHRAEGEWTTLAH